MSGKAVKSSQWCCFPRCLSSVRAPGPGLGPAAWGAAEVLVPAPASFLSLASGWAHLVRHWRKPVGLQTEQRGPNTQLSRFKLPSPCTPGLAPHQCRLIPATGSSEGRVIRSNVTSISCDRMRSEAQTRRDFKRWSQHLHIPGVD